MQCGELLAPQADKPTQEETAPLAREGSGPNVSPQARLWGGGGCSAVDPKPWTLNFTLNPIQASLSAGPGRYITRSMTQAHPTVVKKF